ncbi:tobamovirus multiplication protein 1-like isoform x1 [Anaeramoeba ignava]|uniref:Tobamovirus multiplication protein 1-like isoform x1 n=1 Tax=Anaeramoeba ignava TaxID=1746090 RepID=A0A9Q0LDU9_ANAIG|nr:tobamovirus multiplication protein 1-like isoform x1 [Anaeramoeba ignava]
MEVDQFIVEVIFYSLLLIFLTVQVFRLVLFKDFQLFYDLQIQFHGLMLIFAVARIAVSCISYSANKKILLIFIVKRIAYLSFFTSFTLLLFFWAKISNGIQYHEKTPKSLKIPLLITNAIFYLFAIISIIIFATDVEKPEYSNGFYQINSIIVAAAFLVVSISFLVYGLILIRKLKIIVGLIANRKKFLIKSFFVTLFVSICFLLKFIMFVYHPITDKNMNSWFFLFFAYFIPELLPSITQSIVMGPQVPNKNEEVKWKLMNNEN